MRAIGCVAVLVISFLATAMAVTLPPYGAYQIIRDLDDPHVVSIAEFALEAHNLRTSKVDFKVVNGARRIQDGLYWRLDIRVSSGATYEAVVFESRTESLNLVSFKLLTKV